MDLICRRCALVMTRRRHLTSPLRSLSPKIYISRSFTSTRFILAKAPKKVPIKPHTAPLEYKQVPLESNLRSATNCIRPKAPPTASLSSTPPARPNPFKHRIIPIFFGSITLLFLAGSLSYTAVQLSKTPSSIAPHDPALQQDVSARFDAIAPTFDHTIDFTETLMRLPSLRRKLAQEAQGDVLEVSVGTGRNLEYYDWEFAGKGEKKTKPGRVRGFTAVDVSEEMLEVAHEKFSRLYPGILGIRWVISDAAASLPPAPGPAGQGDRKYDTIVQTMGLCSVRDPVALLGNLGRHIKEEEGRILLLEHGRGYWNWLNKILDRFAEGHAQNFGCWWNRDLGELVEKSGLEVVNMERRHGGTTWWIELKKSRSTQSLEEKDEEKDESATNITTNQVTKKEPAKKGWW